MGISEFTGRAKWHTQGTPITSATRPQSPRTAFLVTLPTERSIFLGVWFPMSNTIDQQTPILKRRPEARGFRVELLLEEAVRGTLRIPHFQRPLRWRTKNVLELFDSIRRGFPIGDLLLSRAHARAGNISFGPVSFSVGEQHTALWVVDGQQRLTALIATLLRQELTPRRDYWAIWYDLENEKFEVLKRREPDATWIPLNVLSDSVKQLKWIRSWPYAEEREDLVNRAFELGKSIREYEVPAYIVEGADDELLRLIFTRSNTGGSPMKEFEIFEALHDKEGEKPIRSAVARLEDLGFGRLDEDLFLRCVRVTCKPMLSEHVGAESHLPENAIQKTESAVRRAIVTITTWAGIPTFTLMPYRLPLYILTAFYDQFPGEDIRVDRLAAHWIWRGALSEQHLDSSDAKIDRLVRMVREGTNAARTMAELIGMLGEVTQEDCRKGLFEQLDRKVSLRSATSKLLVLALLANNPCRNNSDGSNNQPTLLDVVETDAKSDDTLDDDSAVESMLHPKVYCSALLDNDDNLGTDVIIRLAGMKPQLIVNSPDYDAGSFLLSEECMTFASAKDLAGFRSCRREILKTYLPRFVEDRIGNAVDVRPSIASILSTRSISE